MNACVLHAVGDLRFEELPVPVPKPGFALIRVAACGVCGSDVPRVFSRGTYRFPTIIGHEFAGVVSETGAGVEPSLKGCRAAVYPLLACGTCTSCQSGDMILCERYDYLGSRSDGGFAEYVCAPVENLTPVPEGLSFEEAAMTEPAAVSLHALRRVNLRGGDHVAVFGAGPIGLLAAIWARALGAASVTVCDVDPAKVEFARALGFDLACNPATQDAVEFVRAHAPRGADVVVEASGSARALQQGIGAAAKSGRVALLGNAAGDMGIDADTYGQILRKQLSLSGSWNSEQGDTPRDEWRFTVESMACGRIDVKPLITHRVGLGEVPGAIAMMRDRRERFCKVMYVAGRKAADVG